eukprot:9305281-Alexandrium_andersonii.AAC.1
MRALPGARCPGGGERSDWRALRRRGLSPWEVPCVAEAPGRRPGCVVRAARRGRLGVSQLV